MDITKQNTLILVIYIYISSISLLLTPIINTFYVKISLLILLTLYILKKNKFCVSRKIYLFYGTIILFILINILSVSYKSYVFADGVNFLLYSFIPIYLLTQKLISYEYFKEYWFKLAIFFTYLLPIYYLYRQSKIILYFDIGFLSHLNILILVYYLLSQKIYKSKKLLYILYLVINLLVLGILGSRMVLVATLLTSLWTFLLLANKRSIKFYINIIVLSIVGIIISQNLLNILTYINGIIMKFGLNSRNLSLFITQLKGGFNNSTILSGRDEIYPAVVNYLYVNGIFPSGLAVARKLTEGKFYHAHNFILELLLVFGLIGFIVLLGIFIFKLFHLIKDRNISNNQIILEILLILLVSFLIRSLTGTYYLSDPIFLISLGILISIRTPIFNLFWLRKNN